jgi:sec-independent protein translocase protein TatB
MFVDLSWSHILLLLVAALVVVGPKDLPPMMRLAGQWMARARGMAGQLRKGFDEMARQSELDELRTELESLRGERPLADIDRALRSPLRQPPNPAALPPQSEIGHANPFSPSTDVAAPGPPA